MIKGWIWVQLSDAFGPEVVWSCVTGGGTGVGLWGNALGAGINRWNYSAGCEQGISNVSGVSIFMHLILKARLCSKLKSYAAC